ncbi:MAG: ABC transporter permease [Anaerolineae bacterium]|nr:ABC transporter permease [Anaerolineae bacterium]
MAQTLTTKPVIIQVEEPHTPSFFSRFIRNPQAVIGFIMVAVMLLMAVGAEVITTSDPTRLSPRDRYIEPGPEHIFGTDHLGRDILTRMIYGARVSLSVGLAAVTLSALIGTFLGAIAGYFGGWTDIIISRLVDTFLAIPGLVLTIALVSILGSGLDKMVMAIGISSWPMYARLVRGSSISLKETEYVEAARSIGARTPRIIFRHMLPNAIGPILVVMTIGTAGAILTEAGLSFLGIGLEPKIPTWGRMLAEAQEYIRQYPYMSIFPGIGIMLFTLGFNLFGEGLRDLLDPKIRKR